MAAVMTRKEEEVFLRAYRLDALCEQGGTCRYCRSRLPRNKATADHIIPRASGGTTHRENIVAACEPCNTAKGNRSFAQFMKAIKSPAPGSDFRIWRAWMRRRIALATERAGKRILRAAA